MTFIKKIFIALIRFYQLMISPLFPPSCRFTPSCSQYAIDAINIHGPLRGTFLAIGRILRCHPLNRGGYDPVKTEACHKHAVNDHRVVHSE